MSTNKNLRKELDEKEKERYMVRLKKMLTKKSVPPRPRLTITRPPRGAMSPHQEISNFGKIKEQILFFTKEADIEGKMNQRRLKFPNAANIKIMKLMIPLFYRSLGD